MKRSGNREVVGRVTPIDVVVKDFRFEHSDRRRREDIIDLIAFSGSLEAVAGFCPAECGLSLQISYNRIAFAGVEITCHYKWVPMFSLVNTLGQQDGTFFSGRLGNMVQMKIKDIKGLPEY